MTKNKKTNNRKEYHKNYYIINKSEITKKHAKYNIEHDRQNKAQKKEYYLANKEKIDNVNKKYRKDHKHTILKYEQEYRENNDEAITNRRNKYNNEKISGHLTRRKAYWIKKEYNMSIDEYEQLIKEQKNSCAICGEPFINRICVDHNHYTNANRGLLCDLCNFGIGHFKDNINILESAIKYIKKYKENRDE